MIKCKMVGGGFQHQDSVSINNKLPKDFVWVKGGMKSDIDIHIDGAIRLNLNKPKENKYGWVFESEEIFNIKWIIDNVRSVLDSYELIFTHNKKLLDLSDKFVFMPANAFWIKSPEIHKKNKLVSMIYSRKSQTSGHKKRIKIANKYKGLVDGYGRGVNPINNKEEGLTDYMFSIVVENGKYDNYFTEKILDCFATGTIPIYWGCENIGEYFDEGGIIKLTDDFDVKSLTKELYLNKLNSIRKNFERVLNYEILEERVLKYLKKEKI